MSLSRAELDALNVTRTWFKGRINSADLFVASINKSIIRDLQDEGYLRKLWIGWDITKKGRQALSDEGINKFSDTRGIK